MRLVDSLTTVVMDEMPYVRGVKNACGLAAVLELLGDTHECAAGSKDTDQRPEAQDGTEEYPGADHGKSQLASRFINTSHTQSFR